MAKNVFTVYVSSRSERNAGHAAVYQIRLSNPREDRGSLLTVTPVDDCRDRASFAIARFLCDRLREALDRIDVSPDKDVAEFMEALEIEATKPDDNA